MLRSRWQGFNVESGENQAPLLVTHWYVLQQGLVFALFSLPLLAGLGVWLGKRLLKPADQPLPVDWPLAESEESAESIKESDS
ncbi:MAG: hypothetical protein ACAI44_02230 [Candidatus Sericytochromatia bacterium]